jgi:hypothetical protein
MKEIIGTTTIDCHWKVKYERKNSLLLGLLVLESYKRLSSSCKDSGIMVFG